MELSFLKKMLFYAIPILLIVGLLTFGDLIVRNNMSYSFEVIPVLSLLSIIGSLLYLKGYKYAAGSILTGIIIGICKANYIFFMEALKGFQTMNGAYALFGCIFRGCLIGTLVELGGILFCKLFKAAGDRFPACVLKLGYKNTTFTDK